MHLHTRLLAICVASLFWGLPPAHGREAKPSVVKVLKTADGYSLTHDGKPYFIKGVGGSGSLKALVDAGGNSVRTWGTDNLGPILDEAHKHGLTVTVGIWLGHERHGFNYNDADQVAKQYEAVRAVILRYKDHPAVLMWGLGNEMEGYAKGDNAAIWSAINNLATLAKKLDPNHPTMTVVAEIGGDRVKNIHRLCPDLDVVGINSYGGAATIAKRYKEAGGLKPYVLTEFGPPGSWEVKKNDWGVAPEPSSTEKAEFYRRTYREAVLASKGVCLGSYAFIWGHKQEATATWFGLLLPDGRRTGAVDVLTELWTGKPPAHRCPTIATLKLDGADQVEPGALVKATLSAAHPDGDALKVRWVLQREPFALGIGGDAEEVPPTFPEALVKASEKQSEVRMPKAGGGYRLFVYITDEHNGAAVANVALRVKGPVPLPTANRAKLPLILYDESGPERPPYVPTGWMGNVKALKMDESCPDNPHAGKTCIRVEYADKAGWAGVVWQHPASDWGDRPGGWDLTGATRLVFWARGATGEEVVTFEFGLLGSEKKFSDTARGKLDKVKLTKEWKEYRIELDKKDLKRIKTGFAFVLAADGKPVTFFLDDIRYE